MLHVVMCKAARTSGARETKSVSRSVATKSQKFRCCIVGFYPTTVSRALFEILTTRAPSRFSDGRWVESTNCCTTDEGRLGIILQYELLTFVHYRSFIFKAY